MDVDLRSLRALVAVVDAGTFTDAAIELGRSQASVSRAVAALERAVGVHLLHRGPRGATVTTTGAEVLASARRVLAEVDAITRITSGVPRELRVGHAWSAVGRHTTSVQERWSREHPGSELLFVRSATPSAGLLEGTVDCSVLRRSSEDDRLELTLVGSEPRYAALASSDALASRRTLGLGDLIGRTVAVDERTGTTTPDLWPANAAPASLRSIDGVEDWLTLIAAGRAVGVTAEATARQHPRPGVAYRRVRDAPPVPVWLAWRRGAPPPGVRALVRLLSEAYGRAAGTAGTDDATP
jgi:DNA-binding transcriptional LysR family regulator